MTDRFRLLDESVLFERLLSGRDDGRRHLFLVGSPLVKPEAAGQPGVPDASGMIALVREELAGTTDFSDYQQAFEALSDSGGPEAIASVIRRAVLLACPGYGNGGTTGNGAATDVALRGVSTGDVEACRRLERRTDLWHLRPAVAALGALCTEYPAVFGSRILTTNFDPLIQVAIERAGGGSLTTVLHGDGRFANSWSGGSATHVVHVHGYWHGNDTLHSIHQLTTRKPQLEADLRRELRDTVLVVVAYGGWDDVLTSTLEAVARDEGEQPEILWTFYRDDAGEIEGSHAKLLQALAPAVARGRVTFFGGIDCHKFFPDLLRSLRERDGRKAIDLVDDGSPTATVLEPAVVSGSERVGPSPFRPGLPIESDDDFFGRGQECFEIENALRRGNSIQILGERRMGKTSLLRWVERHALDFQERPLVRLDAQGLAGRSPERFVAALAAGLGTTIGEGEDVAEALAGLPPAVLVVDEAENLLRPERGFNGAFLELLRSQGQNGAHVWVSASRQSLPELFTDVGLTSMFLNDAVNVWIGQIGTAASQGLLDRGLSEDGMRQAAHEAGGFPQALQWAGDALGRRPLSAASFVDRFDLAMEPFYRSWWRHCSPREKSLLRSVGGSAQWELGAEDRLLFTALEMRGLIAGDRLSPELPGEGWKRFIGRVQD